MQFLLRTFALAFLLVTAGNSFAQSGPDEKFDMLGLVLALKENSSQYVNSIRSGNLIFLSGKGPLNPDGSYVIGKLGSILTVDQGRAAARLCAIHQLAILKKELGSLSRIKRIIKVTGFVNSSPDFTGQPQVIDGFSLLLHEVFGEQGIHSRSAVGVNSLPFGWAVEVEMIVEIEPE
jgi:enamine deaminase RidA (YjgF/YER057c/UK114 family)